MSDAKNIPAPKRSVLEISAYVPGKSGVPAGVKLHKLSSNESPIGPSPKAVEALESVSRDLQNYPDGSSTALREAIAEVHGLNAANIMCSNGSDEVLGLVASTYLQPGDEAIYTEHGFLIYRIAILAAGATPVVVPETGYRANVDAILASVTPKTKLVFLANPNNPTGTYLPIEEVKRLHEGLPEHVVLVIDAAYAEYVRRNDYEAGIEMVSASKNVIMTRTFSKIFGLAGLRIGWAYAPHNIIDAMDRIRGPFNVNAAAIAAGAAAMRDRSHISKSVDHNEEWLNRVTEALEGIGLEVTPSVGNFVLIHFPETKGKTAADADRFLTSRGYVLRAVGSYGLPNALRMSIGTEQANLGVIETLREFLGNGESNV